MPTQILIVNDHRILSESIGCLLQSEPDMQIVGVAKDCTQAVELNQLHAPDVALVAMDMLASNGLALIKRLLHACPKLRVIALSTTVRRQLIELVDRELFRHESS
jgi:two-component system invasion response regulator UvrY